MQIKLETQRGEAVHTAETAFEADPPDVVVWNGRTFRLLRTDGVWDHKKHVYREANVHDLGGASQAEASPAPTAETALSAKKTKTDRQVSAVLTREQAELLKRVKARGAFTSPKAAIIAGLEALDEKHAMSNDALLKLLAERLDTPH